MAITRAEHERIASMSDDRLISAVVAMANTLGQRINASKRTATLEYKRALKMEWTRRHGDVRMI